MPPLHPFFELSLLDKGALCICFNLARVFLQGAPRHPYTKKFGIIITMRRVPYPSASNQQKVFLHEATTPPLHPFWGELSLLWEVALYFCFDLAKKFLQGSTMPHLHPFFGIVIIGQSGIMLSLRLSQGISSGYHQHSYTKKFGVVITVGRVLRLNRGNSSGCHHATPKPIFSGIVVIMGRGHYASASIQPGYFFRVPPRHPHTIC